MPNEETAVEETAEETVEETAEETVEETAEETTEDATLSQLMDAVRALDTRISGIASEIADLKSVRIESGAEYVDAEDSDIEHAYEDPDPRSIDELDLTL